MADAEQWDEKVNGETVRCYKWGEGQPILLVHGWMGRAGQFRNLIVQLNNMGFACYSFDGIAHGQSTGKQSSILDFADIVELLTEKYGPFRAVIGHSLGGVAVLYARTKFELSNTIITLASPSKGREIVEEFARRINGRKAYYESVSEYIFNKYDREFSDYTAEYIVRQLGDEVEHVHFHDREDQQAAFSHAEAIVSNRPTTKLIETRGLGHNRILKDEEVIKAIIDIVENSDGLIDSYAREKA